jgi:DNA helicase-2/ATP-dependent DNA helicase PcrA
MIQSPYQQAIYDWIEQGSGNALVDAVAGAGKTTTLIEGARRLHTTNACFVAFNKVIAEEIATRLQAIDSPMQASTIHSLGKRCLGKVSFKGNKYALLCREYLQDLPDLTEVLKETAETSAAKYLRQLVNFAQLTLTDPTERNLLDLIHHYALDEIKQIIGRNAPLWNALWRGVRAVITDGKRDYQRKHLIDYNDMVYLPTALHTSTPQFDFIFIDEAQDLNRAQLELVLACKSPQGRLLFVGDRRQSLYGFAGADTMSISNIITRTQAQVLPLSICYRCPSLPIRLAQQVYPDIQPAPSAESGIVAVVSQADFLRQVQPDETGGCAVIGRCTAPLVSLCLKLLQQGKKAKVRGRDIGAGIIDLVERLHKSKRFRFAAFLELLEEYREAQLELLADKPENEMAIDALLDKVETVAAFYQAYREDMSREATDATIGGFISYITDFFSDEDERQCILFSTIHKAKGLEFNVVYALPEKVPHPLAKNAWQYEQELNAEYVLLTRARQALYFIGRLISNLTLPTDAPAPVLETPAAEMPEAVLAEAETILAAAQETEKQERVGGRPRTHKERLQIKVSSQVAAFLRSLKGGDDGYSGYLETLIQSDPRFRAFLAERDEPSSVSCV